MRLVIKNLNNKILDLSSCNASLLHCLLQSGLDWMHACGGKGRCTTCKVRVLSGMENITPLSPAEKRYREQHLLGMEERLSCQVRVTNDLVVEVPTDSKLSHLLYSDEANDTNG
jgi:2Fe-2S ferredoxin